ncbi:MAG TPA: N-acetyltransferase [Novosphingobium sp.]|nr:N-acetyltransferase [Novosphingobium sp.]
MASSEISIAPVAGKADLAAFIDLPFRLYAGDPHWVPPLKGEVRELLTPGKNPFFEHAEVQLFLARRDGRVVGRISAHIDRLALDQPPEQGMGPGTGNWGMMEAEDAAVMAALIARAEEWLREADMTRVLAPLSLSVWDEPGLLVKGADHSPTVMMGHHDPRYQAWIEALGYAPAKTLLTYDLEIQNGLPPLIDRIVASGEKNPRIRLRKVEIARFDEEAATILAILNDAWSDNWGFVPITASEIAYVGKKLRPLVKEDLIMIAELDGEPVAFMMTLPDVNATIKAIRGKLFPFGWARLLWWLRRPTDATMRVPLMGVLKRLQSSRLASQLAFMLIERIRRVAVAKYGTRRSEFGWILEDNQGMVAIADAIGSKINREYLIYAKPL